MSELGISSAPHCFLTTLEVYKSSQSCFENLFQQCACHSITVLCKFHWSLIPITGVIKWEICLFWLQTDKLESWTKVLSVTFYQLYFKIRWLRYKAQKYKVMTYHYIFKFIFVPEIDLLYWLNHKILCLETRGQASG